MTVHRAAVRFGDVAAEYERARPSYPAAAVDHLARELGLAPGAVVADVGAGTGKLTRLLVETGATVHAVEPVAAMREQLVRAAPGASAHDGTAERLPFADGALDAVTAAQAAHWFGDGAPAEIARCLRAGGAVAVVYNVRDTTQTLHHVIATARERVADGAPSHRSGRWRVGFDAGSAFEAQGTSTFPWTWEQPHDLVLEQVRSLAPIAALDAAARADVLDEVRAVLRDEPDPVELRYITEVTIWRVH